MITPIQARMARSALKVGVREVGEATGLQPNTVSRFEANGGNAATTQALTDYYKGRGLSFEIRDGKQWAGFPND